MKLPNLNNLKQKVAIALTLTTVFSIVGLASAQEVQRTYTVINPQIPVSLDPGKNTEGTTKVVNDSNVPLTFSLTVQDFTVTNNLGTPNIVQKGILDNKYSASNWITISPRVFTLKPQEKQVVNYYIDVPADARPGGHYAAIVYAPLSPQNPGGTGGVVNTEIGALFYVTVNGPVNESAKVTKFTANGFQEYGPVNILTEITNFGDLHIAPKGTINVSGLFFNKTQNLQAENIFPGGVARQFTNTFGQTLMFGRYKAELLASYGKNNNLPLMATLYFWVIPWRLIIVIILLIVAGFLGYKYWKKRSQKKDKEPKEEEKVDTEGKEVKTEESTKKVG